MRNRLYLHIVLVILLILVSFYPLTKTRPVTEINWINGSLASKSFDGLVVESDIIAKLEIKKMLEVHQDKLITKFRAKVLQYYKNKTNYSEEIDIYQVATPKEQFRQNPILEVDKSYILFLREWMVPEKEQPIFGPKVLLFVGEGYARFSIEKGKTIPHLKSRQQDHVNYPISLTEFERLLTDHLNRRNVLDEANIEEYISNNIGSKRINGKLFTAYEVLDIEEKNNLTKFYLWTRCSEFKEIKGEVQEGSSISLPITIYAKKKGNKHQIINHEIPTGSTFYEDEVKEIFPKKLHEVILMYYRVNQNRGNTLHDQMEKKTSKYYNISRE